MRERGRRAEREKERERERESGSGPEQVEQQTNRATVKVTDRHSSKERLPHTHRRATVNGEGQAGRAGRQTHGAGAKQAGDTVGEEAEG